MFCPNCAAHNNPDQHYCRTCGLKLDAIMTDLAEQRPSVEYAKIQRRIRRFEVLGVVSLSTAGLIGLCLLLGKAFYYKLVLFGPEVLFWSAFVALMLFGLASVFFFNYSKFINFEKVNPRLAPKDVTGETPSTKKLYDGGDFQPVSVTEHSTELLPRERR